MKISIFAAQVQKHGQLVHVYLSVVVSSWDVIGL